MKTCHEPAREIPVLAETDVLVVGSGPGGLSAAITAARAGARTMLMERYGCFGGVLTQVGVETISWYRSEHTIDGEGIGQEFEARARAAGGTRDNRSGRGNTINAEMFKVIADEMVREAGVTPLLHTSAVGAIVENGVIRGIVTESKSGRQAVLARVVIDATGDADIVEKAGAPYTTTPKEDRLGVTVVFSCAGVDRARFIAWTQENQTTYGDWGESWQVKTTGKEDKIPTNYLQEPFLRAQRDGLIPPEIKSISGSWSTVTEDGEATYLNLNYMSGYDSTDVRDLTRGEMDGRYQAMLAIKALNAYVPGFEKARLRTFGMTLGTRDSRKIRGRYDLTGDDVQNEARFEDAIGIFPEFLDGYGVLALPTTGRYFQVPMGCLIPLEVDNLLVAGRCIAGDRISHASTRNMMCCTVTGQGAGALAAVAVARDMPVSSVPHGPVQQVLRAQGVRLA